MKRLKFYCLLTLTVLTGLLSVTTLHSCQNEEEKSYEKYLYFVETLPGCYEETPFTEFKEWLLTDPNSNEYITLLEEQGIVVHVTQTSDEVITEVSWLDNHEAWENVIQVNTDMGFKAYPGTLADFDRADDECCVGTTFALTGFENMMEGSVYIAVTFTGETTGQQNDVLEVSAFHVMADNTLRRIPGFFHGEHANETGNSMSFHYNWDNWMIYIPAVDAEENATDRFHLYVMDENTAHCHQSTTVSNPDVHPTLRDYDRLVHLYRTPELFVRIDQMPDSTFRYASWHGNNIPYAVPTETEYPEIILSGGTFDKQSQMYSFYNGRYGYHVPAIHYRNTADAETGDPVNPYIYITHDKKEVDRFDILPYYYMDK